MWWGDGGAYFVASFARTSDGSAAQHDGQVWFLDPGEDTIELKLHFAYTPSDQDSDPDGPDNITVSAHGGLIIAEDGDGKQHLVGATDGGEVFNFARNDFNESEFAGPTFSTDKKTLYASDPEPGDRVRDPGALAQAPLSARVPSAGSAGIRRMDDLRGALALMPDAAFLAEPQGAVVAFNAAAVELFGAPELEGQPLARFLPFPPKPGRGWRPAQARRANNTPLPVEACARELDDGRLLYGVRALRDSAVVEEALRYFDVAFDRSPIGMARLQHRRRVRAGQRRAVRRCSGGRPRTCSAAATRS